MKKEDKVSKKKGIGKGPSIKTAISRAKRIGNGVKKAVVGAAIVGTLLGSPIDFTNIQRVQATETDAGVNDVKKLPKVSLKELKGLDKKKVRKNIRGKVWLMSSRDYYTYDNGNYFFGEIMAVGVPGTRKRVQFSTAIGKEKDGTKINRVLVTYHNKKGKMTGSVISLDKLAKLYKQETGKDLKYVKLVGENGVDGDGPYVQVTIIPIDYFGQDLSTVENGTPVMTAGYYRKGEHESAYHGWGIIE